MFNRLRFQGRPIANPKSIVIHGNARFTVLTPRLLRLEWSETGDFEDRGSYAFPTRYAAAPDYTTRMEGEGLILSTAEVVLRYRGKHARFAPDNLSISFRLNGREITWRPGLSDNMNLRGTRRTLDMCDRDAALEEGLFSRAGWFLFDDSRNVLFNIEDGWVAPRPEHELQDWYFAAFGHDYKGGLSEYTRFGGQAPLIPRFVLGGWWSRFWAYSDQDLKSLVGEFEAHDVPLDVLVIDMDWHTPHAWTGYTWNRELFPDPAGFLGWMHDKGLRVTLNLHPAEGVQPFEEVYPRFAEAMGIDPGSGEAVPFRITGKKFVKHYFELLHHPMEAEGVDFWWIDWQQGEVTEMKGLDALPWLNHLHFQDSTRRGQRPMLYSRWGGLGNHRYHIGFSGDTIVGWQALQFQPYFTATASNVAYGWWSHDIGGHMGGPTEPELYARWVQYGALSPCLRLHSSKDERIERRPWAYPDGAYQAAKSAFHLRYRLIPYIYSMAKVASGSGVSLCRPMYYEYPEAEEAYAARYQYFFGDQILAAPIVFPADPRSGLAASDVWVPEGEWIDFTTKELYCGPRWVRVLGDIDRIPMLVKAGGIIPQAPGFEIQPRPALASGATRAQPPDRLVVSVFPGERGCFRLYEDDGLTQAYLQGQHEWTEITSRMMEPAAWEVEIAPVEGRCERLPSRRSYEIRLEGSLRPDRVLVDGAEMHEWTYDAEALATIIPIPRRNKRSPIHITARAEAGLLAVGQSRNQSLALADVGRILDRQGAGVEQDFDSALRPALANNQPGKADAVARLGGPFVRWIEFVTPEEAAQQLGRLIVAAPAGKAERYDLEVEFKRFDSRAVQPASHSIRLEAVSGSRLLDAPFRYDGRVRSGRWEASVKLDWRSFRLEDQFQSDVFFPAIHSWQALFYEPQAEPLELQAVMDARGRLDPALPWKKYRQQAASVSNLTEPFGVWLFDECRSELEAGRDIACYLAAGLQAAETMEAVLLFQGGGAVEFYLNGRKLDGQPQEAGAVDHVCRANPFGPPRQKLSGLRFLRGLNTLLVKTRPLQGMNPTKWFFGAAPAGRDLEWLPGLEVV